jgi:hypothetical protein
MNNEKEIFEYLDLLRDSGLNMFGARPYIMEQFDMNKKEAGEILEKYLKQ